MNESDVPKAVVTWLKQHHFQLTPAACSCIFPSMGMIPGYKGREAPGCLDCCDRCPRCRQPSSNNDYNSGTCYGCAVGDNDSWHEDEDDEQNDEQEEEEKVEPPLKKR